ncbi:alpha/beta hydrolase family protein [Streptomyces gobiensis]|uniref:alpha/beta hydrolase family protein n=1 Tax=Streptomyces gobiensis TaxID=2875706 RepID=UPI001E3B9C1C|nr:prolyl oligopeptidase family serine peptidase [Streptomyces gobiensis]UGY94419.1 prolyl oligopeptidase family serine peptidase [Streptomyces gobiensis]
MTTAFGVTHALAHGLNGKPIDIYRPGAADPGSLPTVLLWHGRGPDERDVLQPLAETAARLGAAVLVPDWRSDAPDGGRAHLLDSLEFAREYAASPGGGADRLVLAGWSAGGPAAVGIALRPDLFGGWRPMAALSIAARYDWPSRTTGNSPLSDLARTSAPPLPVWLVHGTADVVIDSQHSQEFADALHGRGWPVHLEEPDTDHAGVVMTEYVPDLDRCRPTTTDHALLGGTHTARLLTHAAGLTTAS